MSTSALSERMWSGTGEYKDPLARDSKFTFQTLSDYGAARKQHILHTGKKVSITCMEDGIRANRVRLQNTDLIRVASAGVLNVDGVVDRLRDRFKAPGALERVYWHKWCGAVGLQIAMSGSNEDPDVVARRAATEVNARLGGGGVEGIHLLHRPVDLHPARTVYYDGTYGGCDPSRNQYLPQGLTVSRGWMGEEIGKHDAELAASIALGAHGFGPLFTEENPLWFVGITDNDPRSMSAGQLGQELLAIRESVWRTTLGDEGSADQRMDVDLFVVAGGRTANTNT